jgi:hypothetical protein
MATEQWSLERLRDDAVQLGVSSGHERIGRAFLDEHLPAVVRGRPLTSRGRFDVSPA